MEDGGGMRSGGDSGGVMRSSGSGSGASVG